MRAGVFRGVRSMPIEEVPDPVAGPRDIVLAVRACGVCGSDLHAYTSGKFAEPGQIMGHEFAGEVLERGTQVGDIAVGDRVTGLPIQPCGRCRRCRESAGHLCEVWSTRSIAFGLPGAFAERLRLPEATLGVNVHRLPDSVGDEAGALVEPLAVAVHAVREAAPRPGRTAVVLGLGVIGLHIAQVLRAEGVFPVLGIDRSPLRRSTAERLGVSALGDVADLPADPEIDVVFEVTGASPMVPAAVEIAKPRGLVVVVALYEQPARLDPTRFVHKELTVRGSAMVTPDDFRDALALLGDGRVLADPLITHRMPLTGLADAFEAQTDADSTVKVMITP